MEHNTNYYKTRKEKNQMFPEEVEKENNRSISGKLQPMKDTKIIRVLRVDLIASENLTATFWG